MVQSTERQNDKMLCSAKNRDSVYACTVSVERPDVGFAVERYVHRTVEVMV